MEGRPHSQCTTFYADHYIVLHPNTTGNWSLLSARRLSFPL